MLINEWMNEWLERAFSRKLLNTSMPVQKNLHANSETTSIFVVHGGYI
jgi:hypothetical protein